MTPLLREVLRHLIGTPDYLASLTAIDAFIAREGAHRFTELAQFNGPLDTPEDERLRERLLRRILEALEDRGLGSLEDAA